MYQKNSTKITNAQIVKIFFCPSQIIKLTECNSNNQTWAGEPECFWPDSKIPCLFE